MKILLVEDHAALAEMSCRVLSDVYDHEVARAANGADALTMIEAFAPEIVLVDINLPDMNGYDLAKRIRGQAMFASTLLIALTGFGNIINSLTTEQSGFDAHFRKPMDFELLPGLREQLRK